MILSVNWMEWPYVSHRKLLAKSYFQQVRQWNVRAHAVTNLAHSGSFPWIRRKKDLINVAMSNSYSSISYNNAIKMHYILKFILGLKLFMYRTLICPSSGVFHLTHSNGICQQTWKIYNIAVRIVKNSWWWTEELSETCRVWFQE
jgi:hypothetical protein